MKVSAVVLLLLLAMACSTVRFGQRENGGAPLSDSDCYLDMARVFTGRKAAFDTGLSTGPSFPWLRVSSPRPFWVETTGQPSA